MIQVHGTFDGGNPQDSKMIVRLGENEFRVLPESEDGEPGYKFRLDIILDNQSDVEVASKLVIDWQESRFIDLKNILFCKSPNKGWKALRAQTGTTNTFLTLDIPPGKTQLTLNPSYNYGDYLEFITNMVPPECFQRELLFTTTEGRQIYLLKSPSRAKTKKRILVTARVHPYETAGSYCVEGILENYGKAEKPVELADVDLWIIPMVCPDGVANGLCRLNEKGAPDLSREIDFDYGLCKAYVDAIESIRPHLFIEFHNWMIREGDGIFYLPWWQMNRILRNLDKRTQTSEKRTWVKGLRYGVLKRHPKGLQRFAQERCGSRCMTIEFPWYERDEQEMRWLGWNTLLAAAACA